MARGLLRQALVLLLGGNLKYLDVRVALRLRIPSTGVVINMTMSPIFL